MPSDLSLAKQRNQLLEELIEDLSAGLQALKEILPAGSTKYNLAAALLGKYRQAVSDKTSGRIPYETYRQVIDSIRAEAIDVINSLESPDFEVPGPSGPAAKEGSILYRVPHRMQHSKPGICTIRIALNKVALTEGMEEDEDVKIKERIEVSDMMKAEILDPEGEVFTIRPLSELEQLVRPTGHTQWLFSVTPKQTGEHQLLIKVSMMEYLPQLGRYVPKEISVLEKITVITQEEQILPVEEGFKTTGDHITLGPNETQTPKSDFLDTIRKRKRLLSSFLFVFLTVFVIPASWGLIPQYQRDWWLASWKDNAESYAAYITKYREDVSNPHLEKAYYYKALQTEALTDLLNYKSSYGEAGQYIQPVTVLLNKIELQLVDSIKMNPTEQQIHYLFVNFPSTRFIGELAQLAAQNPVLLAAIRPKLEETIYQQAENALSADVFNALILALEANGRIEAVDRVIEIVQQKPEIRDVVLPLLLALRERMLHKDAPLPKDEPLRQSEVKKEAPDTDHDGLPDPADGCPTDPAKTAPGSCGCGHPETDSDADAIPDCKDKCPAEGGNVDAFGCPVVPPKPDPFDLNMVFVKGGKFNMGCTKEQFDCYEDEKPVHPAIVKDFYLSKYEVTQKEWYDIMGNRPTKLKGCDNCPVVGVSHEDIEVFLAKLNEKTGKKYRLPTEAEWEYAARGGIKTRNFVYAGSDNENEVSWNMNNSGKDKLHPVGEKKANELGLYDMSGNVWEWCSSRYGRYTSTGISGFSGYNVLRGGSAGSVPQNLRVSFRRHSLPGAHDMFVGFRLARTY